MGMKLTRNYKRTIVERLNQDPEFLQALRDEAYQYYQNGELDMLDSVRDLVVDDESEFDWELDEWIRNRRTTRKNNSMLIAGILAFLLGSVWLLGISVGIRFGMLSNVQTTEIPNE